MPKVRAGDLEVFWIERGAGAPVIFCHGNWSTSSWWEPALERLPTGVRGIAYDMRGRGRTVGPDSSYSIPSLAGDLVSFADALGLADFHLVGHSLGSAVAMQVALDCPGRPRSLTALSPAWIDGLPPVFDNAAHQRALSADPGILARALGPLAPACPRDAFWERLIAEGHGQRLEAALLNLDALRQWIPGDRLGTLKIPTTVISGALDILIGAETPRRVAAAMNASHVVLPSVGHCAQIEAPDAFAEALWRTIKTM